MPTTRLPIIPASWWTSLNMSDGGVSLYSEVPCPMSEGRDGRGLGQVRRSDLSLYGDVQCIVGNGHMGTRPLHRMTDGQTRLDSKHYLPGTSLTSGNYTPLAVNPHRHRGLSWALHWLASLWKRVSWHLHQDESELPDRHCVLQMRQSNQPSYRTGIGCSPWGGEGGIHTYNTYIKWYIRSS